MELEKVCLDEENEQHVANSAAATGGAPGNVTELAVKLAAALELGATAATDQSVKAAFEKIRLYQVLSRPNAFLGLSRLVCAHVLMCTLVLWTYA